MTLFAEKKEGPAGKLPSPSAVLESLRHALTYYRRKVDERSNEVSEDVALKHWH